MNSSTSYHTYKSIQTNPRFIQRSPQPPLQKPKPRQSQPPLISPEFGLGQQYIKSYKEKKNNDTIQLNGMAKHYKSFKTKNELNTKLGITSLNNIQSQFSLKNYQNEAQINKNNNTKISQQISPKNDSLNWLGHKYNNGFKNLPNSPNSSATLLQNYQTNQKKLIYKPDSFQYKQLFEAQLNRKDQRNIKNQIQNNFQNTKKSIQTQQLIKLAPRKTPRFSQPGLFSQKLQDQFKEKSQQKFYNQNRNKKFEDSSSIRVMQSQSTKYLNKYVPNQNIQGKTPQFQLSIKNQFYRKQKEIKDVNSSTFINNSNNISSTNTKAKFKIQQKNSFKLSDFQKGKELGSGKFGQVSLVKHKKTGFICAMKSIPKLIIKEQNIINQFIREIKIQTFLDNPNITKLYGFFNDQENIYLLLQLCSEGQLYDLFKLKKKFNQKTVIYLIKQLCEAIKYLHIHNIIHRDIKPENIVMQYGTIKLCDFGWAVCRGGELRSTFCGTPLYVSPQILKGQMYDQKIDIWAIGIMTYQLLIGNIPFQITTQQELIKIIKQEIVFPANSNISIEAKDFILKILRKNPDDRLKIGKLLEHGFLQQNIQLNQIEL